MQHISPRRLFELSQKASITDAEQKHLRECEQCERILAVLARQFDESHRPYDEHDKSA